MTTIPGGPMTRTPGCAVAALVFAVAAGTAAADVPVPAPGASPRIDAIKKAGVLRVGVLANAPWLVENTSGQGEAWSGPAWLLAKEYAKRLHVKLEPVPVSHETKVPVLASNQVDISVTPLAETQERLKVVDSSSIRVPACACSASSRIRNSRRRRASTISTGRTSPWRTTQAGGKKAG